MEHTNETKLEKAKKRVTELKEFYEHLGVFVLVNLGLTLLNAFTVGFSQGVWWVQWVLFGWGIGLGAHALTTFGVHSLLGKNWEEKKLKELMEKDNS